MGDPPAVFPEEPERFAPLRPSEIATDYEVRRYANALALSVRLFAEIGPVEQSRNELEQLLATQMRTRTLGGQDFATWCLCSSMERLGEWERAYSILVEYARVYRRELGPLPYYLEELSTSLTNRRLDVPPTV